MLNNSSSADAALNGAIMLDSLIGSLFSHNFHNINNLLALRMTITINENQFNGAKLGFMS